jgi:hypothetical protein
LAIGGNGDGAYVNESFSDVTSLSMDATHTNWANQKGAGVLFRWGPGINGYAILFVKNFAGTSMSGYVQQYTNGTYSSVFAGSVNMLTGTTARVVVSATGTAVTVKWYIDAVLKDSTTFTDSTFTTNKGFGINTYGGATGSSGAPLINRWDIQQ